MLTRNSRKTEANGKICDNADYNVVLAGILMSEKARFSMLLQV